MNDELGKLTQKVLDLEQTVEQLNRQVKILSKIASFNHTEWQISHYVEHKRKMLAVGVSQTFDRNFRICRIDCDLYELNERDNPFRNKGHMWATITYDEKDKGKVHVKLEDFTIAVRRRSQGYGSILLDTFLFHIKQYLLVDTLVITGMLSQEDEKNPENQQRRDDFYKKFGFELNYETRQLKKVISSKQDELTSVQK
ncbi:hypothetical protein [Pseudolactococcus yaeyamensis]